MGFEVFSRKVRRTGSPTVSITKLGRFAFNKASSLQIRDKAVESVLLLWDKDKRCIGVQPITKQDNRAYKVNWSKRGDGCGFTASTFLTYIEFNTTETKSVPMQWNEQEQMFIIQVPAKYFIKDGTDKITKLKRREKQTEQT
jgi:hypothetical protein